MVAVVAKAQQDPQLAWFLTGATQPSLRQSTYSGNVRSFFYSVGFAWYTYLVDLWPGRVIIFSNSSAVQVEN